MDNIVYSNNPNEGTVQAQIEGKYRKVTLTRAIDNTADILYQDNPNVGKVLFTGEDGKKHTATLVMDINGGGDQHNLGWYATQSALETAHPTAEDGDWAIVGATDTVWVWDSDTNAWKDTDQKGQVTSVNGQTGVVSLDINDVAPTQTGKSGYVLGTDGFVAGWVVPEKIQRSALPQASEDELGNVYQFMGATDSTYTNGYFYKCVSDGQEPATYSWERTDVQPGSSLPSQSGNSGKFLTTDGTDASWGTTIGQGLTINASGMNTTACNVVYNNKSMFATYIYGGDGLAQIWISTFTGSTKGVYNLGTSFSAGTQTPNVTLGKSDSKWANVYAKKINNGADIDVPTTGGTLALTSDLPHSPATMPTLAVADWSSNTQTVTVSGVTATNTVFVSPAPASAADYAAANVLCVSQSTNSLTFQCASVPASDLTVNVVIIGA